jgi:hypothetical protein
MSCKPLGLQGDDLQRRFEHSVIRLGQTQTISDWAASVLGSALLDSALLDSALLDSALSDLGSSFWGELQETQFQDLAFLFFYDLVQRGGIPRPNLNHHHHTISTYEYAFLFEAYDANRNAL